MTYATYVVVNGLVFPETPRWHLGHFWFTDQFTGRVMRLSLDGMLETIATLPDHIGGLGWLPDGSLLTVGMKRRRAPPGRRPGSSPTPTSPAWRASTATTCWWMRAAGPMWATSVSTSRAGPRRSPPS